MKNKILIKDIQNRIFTIRGLQVMIDRDLAELYEVSTKVLNQAVKRNIARFPGTFRFQLSETEKTELVTNCDRFKKLKHSSVNPYAFTEQGVAMLSAVLRSETAIKVSIKIMQAFVKMKKFITNNAAIFQRLDKIEQRQFISETKLDKVFKALESGELQPNQGIFFNGQVFDAYTFVSDLIRSAKKSIILIDNYIDDTVLTHFAKRGKDVDFYIFTKKISKQLKLDIEKHNQQYPTVKIRQFDKAHDRFLIMDQKEVYHFGASLKDLGKKWFAFSKMEKQSIAIMENLKLIIENEKNDEK